MKNQDVMFSSAKTTGSDCWETPQDLFDQLNEMFKFNLDPCASHENHKCEKYFTEEDDGLIQSWEGHSVFVNPPYSKCYNWIKKCWQAGQKSYTTVVALVPARTDTKWFHEFVWPDKASSVAFIKGRLKFTLNGNPMRSAKGTIMPAPFPSMLIVWGGEHLKFAKDGKVWCYHARKEHGTLQANPETTCSDEGEQV